LVSFIFELLSLLKSIIIIQDKSLLVKYFLEKNKKNFSLGEVKDNGDIRDIKNPIGYI